MLKYLLYCLITVIPAFAQDNVVSIDIIGLKKTKASFVRSFIDTREGTKLDSAQVKQDAQNLRNLQLFSDVDYRIIRQESGVRLQFHCKEITSIIPISNFGSIESSFWFQLGAVDYNWLGRGNTLGGYYRYYDRNSFETYLKSPYLFGPKWGLSAYFNLLATTEPAYFSSGTTYYNTDRWTAIILGRHSFSRKFVLQAGGGYLVEKYIKNTQRNEPSSPGPVRAEFKKYLAKIAFSINHINYYYHYLSGFLSEFNVETIKTHGESKLFWKVENILRYYNRVGSKGNAAIRLRTGIAENTETPFVPFVLDSYQTVRGAGNRVARGTAEITLNFEYRHTFLEQNWGAVQGVGFSDLSAWRKGGESLSSLFKKSSTVSFVGFGARLYIKRFNHLILRADFGISVTESNQNGVVIGLGQYF
ncbi:hypothetical protein IIC38_05245 [candidate division KSB1 bacterium]|nr:hypothetical protein [candidate division KSB1 bacterium]